jgi:hypothetical protein
VVLVFTTWLKSTALLRKEFGLNDENFIKLSSTKDRTYPLPSCIKIICIPAFAYSSYFRFGTSDCTSWKHSLV